MLMRLLKAAAVPYCRALEQWLYQGVVDDPYDEFLIIERKVPMSSRALLSCAVHQVLRMRVCWYKGNRRWWIRPWRGCGAVVESMSRRLSGQFLLWGSIRRAPRLAHVHTLSR